LETAKGGEMMDSSATATTGYGCKHRNGWFVTVKIWIFKRRVFVCSDCGFVFYHWNIPEKVGHNNG
jgi:hypothetical protein